MDGAPSLETVYRAVYTLHHNPDPTEKEKASLWLGELQKSVYAWKISDDILHRSNELEWCYFAAQTMRTKIQLSFHELPAHSHVSLRDSLMEHISKVNENTNSVIVTQLCVALSDLALQMCSWEKPVIDLIERYSTSAPLALLEILTVLPEETSSRALRLGANRRRQVLKQFSISLNNVTQFLKACLENAGSASQIQTKVLKCFTSWVSVHVISLPEIVDNIVVATAFHVLSNRTASPLIHEAAADCVCALLQCLEDNNNQQEIEMQLFNGVLSLERPFHLAVAHEDHENCVNYCRVFTELAESFLDKIISGSTPENLHFAIKIFDLVLACVGHHDYEVAAITFNLWYRLSEELYQKNNDRLTLLFKPYIERLIEALCRHCQIEPDHEGLLEEMDDFPEFRSKVAELIRDVVFVVGSANCFRQMFMSLQSGQGSWDTCEAALFIMQAVANNIIPEENDVVPKVVESLLNLPANTHVAVRHTSLLLLGQLSEWIEKHPQYLEAVLNSVTYSLHQDHRLASAAANCLQGICVACKEHMPLRFSSVLQVLEALDKLQIPNTAHCGLIKGGAAILENIPPEQLQQALRDICLIQVKPLCHLIEKDIKPERGTKTDPAVWLDRLSAIFRHVNLHPQNGGIHPCQPVITEIWPVLSSACTKYQADGHITERCCRCLRYIVRCLGKHSAHLLQPMVKQIVTLYAQHQHSCYLYLGSILVDEYATDPGCTQGLIDMLQVFIGPTFTILQEPNGLKNHPDTVDDLFRLCGRFLQRAPVAFLTAPCLGSILQCALMAVALDHRDANASVMKFFYDLVHAERLLLEDCKDDELRKNLGQRLIEEKGQELITNLIQASVFYLHTYMLSDVADVIMELMITHQSSMGRWVEEAIKTMPTQNSGGSETATPNQLEDFHRAVMNCESSKIMTHTLRDFARLYR